MPRTNRDPRTAETGHGYPQLAFTFGTLRANDLIWRYVVDSYLKGATPDAFDLLYWDSDSVSLPGPMYCWYTRNTYLWRIRRSRPKDWLPSNPRPHPVEGIGSRGRQRTGDGTRYLKRLEPDLATRFMN